MEGAKPAEKAKPAKSGKWATSPSRWANRLPDKPEDRRKLLRWGVVVLAVLIGLIAWIATRDDDDGAPQPTPVGFEARIVTQAELEEIAGSAEHAVYWAGFRPGKQLEASEGEDGSVQVRYLDQGQEPGGDRAGTLTIGSYPLADATGALEGFAERDGAIVRASAEVGEVVSSNAAPSSVYFTSPDGGVQIEVYDPSPARAMSLALSGQVQPVG